jgi:hypothetical protein
MCIHPAEPSARLTHAPRLGRIRHWRRRATVRLSGEAMKVSSGWGLTGVVTCMLLAGCTASEQPDSSQSYNSLAETVALRVGDCLDTSSVEWGEASEQTSPDGLLDSLPAVSCDQPHGGQVILVDEDFWARTGHLPSERDLNAEAAPPCAAAVPAVTGGPLVPPYALFFIGPQPSTWAVDRRLVCVLIEMGSDGLPVQRRTPIEPA